jgi:predicted glycoside hydrolase/deacetylase ChbG (UPF0249 family)
MGKVYIHADDLGLSKGITNGILTALDRQGLNSVSLVPNGYAFDYAVNELKKRPGVRRAIHLNFAEGKPVGDSKGLKRILDSNGEFRLSFLTLWLKYFFSGGRTKAELKSGIRAEIRAQVAAVTREFDGALEAHIDSHQYYHMIPFIFDALLELRDELKIKYIRIPREPFFIHIDSLAAAGNYVGQNILKHIVLNVLSLRCVKKLKAAGIAHNDYLIGILFSGNMTAAAARKALRKIRNRTIEHGVEVVFHPGVAAEDEKRYWADRPVNYRFYFSRSRDRELQELTRHLLTEDQDKRYE